MASKLSDLIMQLSYYQGGGKDPGNRDIDKVDKIASTVGDIGKDHYAFKKASLENKKAQQGLTPMSEIRGYGKLPSEQEELDMSSVANENMKKWQEARTRIEQESAAKLNSPDGIERKNRFMDTLTPGQQANIPQELIDSQVPVGQVPQMPEPFLSKRREYFAEYPNENPDLSLDQWKELKAGEASESLSKMRAGGKQYQSLLPAIQSGYVDRDFAKSIIPELGDTEDISIGTLKDRIGMLKQDKALGSIEGERAGRKEERGDDRVLRFASTMENDPVIKEAKKQTINIGQVGAVLDLARGGNTVAAAALGMKMARTMGEVGTATDGDVVRYVQSNRLDRKAGDILSKWINGTPSDASMQEIAQIVAALEGIYDEKVQPVYNKYVDRLARNIDVHPEKAAYLLAVPYKPGISSDNQTQQQATNQEAPVVGGMLNGSKILSVERAD